MSGKWALAIRGPLSCFEGPMLPQCFYKFAITQGMGRLSMACDAKTVAEHVVLILEEAARKHDRNFRSPGQGPMNCFGAVARDYQGNYAVAHKNHPYSPANCAATERVGQFSNKYGCVSIAANTCLAEESARKLSLPRALGLKQFFEHVKKETNRNKVIGGMCIDTFGNVGIAVGNTPMAWIFANDKSLNTYGSEMNEYKEFVI